MWKLPTILISIVLILVAVGLVMLASTSASLGLQRHGDPNYFVFRQFVWLLLAVCAAVVSARLDYHQLKWAAVPLLGLSVVLLAMCLVPGVGRLINGSRRWLMFHTVNIQPSELAKYASVVFLAWYLDKARRHIQEFTRGVLIPGVALAVVLGLIFLEPDYGTTVLIATVAGVLMYLGGVRKSWLVAGFVVAAAGFAVAVACDEERMNRVISFWNPEKYAADESFQLMNAIYGFVAGGGAGAGLGQGMQKRFYLPEAHTDFIFAIVGEELGLAATLGILLLFAALFICGLVIAAKAPDGFGRLLAWGVTLTLVLQALINMGVVTGSLPTKGMALPFISYGGSSLVVCGLQVGLLVNVALHAGGVIRDEESQRIKDRLQRF